VISHTSEIRPKNVTIDSPGKTEAGSQQGVKLPPINNYSEDLLKQIFLHLCRAKNDLNMHNLRLLRIHLR
jgi:hypothetical protein